MRVIILGCGKIGMAIREFLEDVKDVKAITCIDKRVMGTTQGKVNYKKVNLEFITSSDVKGGNILINTVKDLDKERLARMCKMARINLIDVTIPGASGVPTGAKDIGSKRKEWMIFGGGASSGITSIMANKIYTKMKEKNELREMTIMYVQSRTEQKYEYPFGADEAIEYALIEPVKSINGEIARINDYHRVKVQVPNSESPIGTFTFRDYYGPEVVSLSHKLKDVTLMYKFGGADADYLDAIRTMYRSLKQMNGEEDAKAKVRKFFMPNAKQRDHVGQNGINGVSGIFINVDNVLRGFAVANVNPDDYGFLNYATYPIAVFVGAVINEYKNIQPGAYMPENLDVKVQESVLNTVKKHFKVSTW